MIFGTDEADSQQLLERFIDVDVLPHCLHPGGLDGRVARGFEHVIMEGGLIPVEGTYTTPDHCKQGRTRAEEKAFLLLAHNNNNNTSGHDEDDAVVAASKVRQQKQEQKQRRGGMGADRPVVRPKQCQVLGKGSFEFILSSQGNYKTRIAVDI